MTRKCKMCELPDEQREQIENAVREGHSFKEAAAFAKDIGVNISHTSIQRHYQQHLTDEERAPINTPIFDPVDGSNWENVKEGINKNLQELTANITSICNEKVKSYMLGAAPFPDKELRALQGVHTLANKTLDFDNKN